MINVTILCVFRHQNGEAAKSDLDLHQNKMQRLARMKRELQMLQQSLPHGISCWAKVDNIEQFGSP